MKRYSSRSLGLRIGGAVAVIALLGLAWGLFYYLRSRPVAPTSSERQNSIPNNNPMPNPGGEAATFSTQGSVNLTGGYFHAQGTNGRSCATCHIPEEAWSITPATLQRLFDETDGTHPVFNLLDANNPNMDVSTREARQLTDAGLGNITGLWNDLGRFKTPTLRGLAARAPYFHNGIARTLEDVVRHYENHFGFIVPAR